MGTSQNRMNFNITRKGRLTKSIQEYIWDERDCIITAVPVDGYFTTLLFSHNSLPKIKDNS